MRAGVLAASGPGPAEQGWARRWARPVLFAAVAAELAVGVGRVASLPSMHRSPAAVSELRESSGASVAPTTTGPAAAALAQREREVRLLLDQRALAVLARDRSAFLATVDAAEPGFHAAQRRYFDRLAGVPLASWRYTLRPDAEPPAGVLARQGEAWTREVSLEYALAGFDPEPTVVRHHLTFVRRDAGWVLASDSDFEPAGLRTPRELWDFGPVEVVRGRHTLVLGHPGRRTLLHRLAAQSDAAVPRVSAAWGSDWSAKVVVVVPDSEQELSAIVGDGKDLSRIVAVSVAELSGTPGGGSRPVGNRVLVNPRTFARLGPVGRRVVLSHEIAHVATRPATGPAVPAWLVEGYADYVGYRDTGVSARAAAAELRRDVQAGRLPRELPTDTAFETANPRLAQAYEMSWLACRLIVARAGEAGLVRFYRQIGRAAETDDAAVRRAFADVLRLTPEGFTALWRDYLSAQLA